MNADIKWLDNPEIFRINQIEAHSDHRYYLNYTDLEKGNNEMTQSLNGCWNFCFSKNAKSRPINFYEENFDLSNFDKFLDEFDKIIGIDKIYCVHIGLYVVYAAFSNGISCVL